MLSKNQLKFVTSLKQKKFRGVHNSFIAEGKKVVDELLKSSIKVKQIYSTTDQLSHFSISNDIEIIETKKAELERISAFSSASDVMAVCEMPNYDFKFEDLQKKLTLVLDNIKDPGNLGTIIRIADWFGIENIVCNLETVDEFNPKTIQATMGSIARVKVHRMDLTTILDKKNTAIQSFGAILGGKSIYETKLPSEGFIIIGSESHGISKEILPMIDTPISIPSYAKAESENAESLNAAIATAIICGEFRRTIASQH